MADRVLVTGGAGYIGSHVTRKLLERGEKVRILDNFLYGDQGLAALFGHPNLEVRSGDICDRAVLEESLKGVCGVIALAALVGDAACELDSDRTLATNYRATETILNACEKSGVRRLVFASSCSVYGAKGSVLLDEESDREAVSLYGRTRILSEDLLGAHRGGLELVVLRLATVCGSSPRMRFDLMVNTMTACATFQGVIRVSGASHWRPHLHVQDAAEGFLRALQEPGLGGEIFNVGADTQNFTIGEIAERVAARVPGTRVEQLSANGDQRSYRVSFAKIRGRLGFEPRFTIDDAIDEVHGACANGQVGDFTHERYHNAKWLNLGRRSRGAA